MLSLILWLVMLSLAVTWGGLGWQAARRYRERLHVEWRLDADKQREHWRALGATYGAVQTAKAELRDANERLAELEVMRRLLLRYHKLLVEYVDPETYFDPETDVSEVEPLLNEGRVALETAGLLEPERREVVS